MSDNGEEYDGEEYNDEYDQLEHQDQVYKIPDTYIGSIAFSVGKDYVYDMQTGKLNYVHVQTPPGVQRLLLEIVSNAMDNVLKSRELGIEPYQV
jgi:DNA gyrase/topoisomerase IV subunit B